jgi:hypothetical protein
MDAAASWCGWFKGAAGAPWRCLARADSLTRCHELLLREIRRLGLRGHRLLTAGRSPDAVLAAGRAVRRGGAPASRRGGIDDR